MGGSQRPDVCGVASLPSRRLWTKPLGRNGECPAVKVSWTRHNGWSDVCASHIPESRSNRCIRANVHRKMSWTRHGVVTGMQRRRTRIVIPDGNAMSWHSKQIVSQKRCVGVTDKARHSPAIRCSSGVTDKATTTHSHLDPTKGTMQFGSPCICVVAYLKMHHLRLSEACCAKSAGPLVNLALNFIGHVAFAPKGYAAQAFVSPLPLLNFCSYPSAGNASPSLAPSLLSRKVHHPLRSITRVCPQFPCTSLGYARIGLLHQHNLLLAYGPLFQQVFSHSSGISVWQVMQCYQCSRVLLLAYLLTFLALCN